MERCRSLAAKGAELHAELEEKNKLLDRIEKRFGHAPSAAAELAKLKQIQVYLIGSDGSKRESKSSNNNLTQPLNA
jgi:hypothetical protein